MTPRNSPVATDIMIKMVRLIREELHHFEQVLAFIKQRNIPLEKLSAATYASQLFRDVRTYEPQAAVDKLIIGAYIEARSCERFAALAPLLSAQGEAALADFYLSLLRSEARHYQDYLVLAKQIDDATGSQSRDFDEFTERVTFFGQREAALITQPDANFRFHSGVPCSLASG